MLRLALFAATAWVALRVVQENLPRIPRGFDLPGGDPSPADKAAGGGRPGGAVGPGAPE